MKGTLPLIAAFLQIGLLAQQSIDTTKPTVLKEVTVTGIKTVRGTGHMPEEKDGLFMQGKRMKFYWWIVWTLIKQSITPGRF
jgi:Fe(3+) dicitrate transport protein